MSGSAPEAADVLAEVVREQWARLVTRLLARYRRLDLVEDALGDAVEQAARRWPAAGTPDVPAAWLSTAASRRVLDRLRAETMAQRKLPLLLVGQPERAVRADDGDTIEDDLLRLVLMCTHPALDTAAASALALRLVLGVSTADVARLFLVPEPTMAARITRAKKKIVATGIPFTVPPAHVLPERLEVVAQVAYLAFTAGYAPGSGPDVVRVELASEAVRLVRIVLALRPGDPTLTALLALMLLQHSRRDARTGADGGVVLLPDQDRTRWRHDEIGEAVGLLGSRVLRGPIPWTAASYALQARIAAEHATAERPEATDWRRIVALYDTLIELSPSPPARLARAVAVGEADGPEAGLAALDALDDAPPTHRLPAVRAAFAARAGRLDEAAAAYDLAITRCGNEAERQDLIRRRDALRMS